MPRCSQTIAALVTALAKAQIELTNPEKSLIGTLPAERGQEPRRFRYASRRQAGLNELRGGNNTRLIFPTLHGRGYRWLSALCSRILIQL